jgi:hypothetical protein
MLRKNVSLAEFGAVEANFKNQIEEKFINELDHYVKLVDMVDYDF